MNKPGGTLFVPIIGTFLHSHRQHPAALLRTLPQALFPARSLPRADAPAALLGEKRPPVSFEIIPEKRPENNFRLILPQTAQIDEPDLHGVDPEIHGTRAGAQGYLRHAPYI